MADNEVEIVIDGRDITGPMWESARKRADVESKAIVATVARNMSALERVLDAIGERAGASLADSIEGELRESDDDAKRAGVDVGEAFSDGVDEGMDGIDDKVRKGGEESGRKGGDGMRKGLISRVSDMASDLAGSLGGKLAPLLSKLPVGAPIAASVLAAAPLIGATLSAVVVAGLGSAAIGGGIALAIKDPTVKAEAVELGEFIGDELKDAAAPFIPATRQAIAIFRGDWKRIDGDIDDTFSAAAKYLPTLAQGLSNSITRLTPGIKDAVEGFEPIVNVISNELPQVATAVSDLFSNMGEDAEDSATALAAVFALITDSIEMINTATTGLTKAWGGSLDMIEDLAAATPDWTPLGAGAEWAAGKVGELRKSTEGAGASLRDLREPLDGNAHAAEAMAERTEIMSGTMAEAVEAAGSLKDALDVLNGGTLDARAAARNYQKAIDDLNEGMKENGRTLNINTEKGRENQANLDNLAESIGVQMNAIYAQTEATQGSAAAQIAANGVYERGRGQLIRAAMAAGMGEKAARRYANSVLGIPKNWKTDYKSNAAAARDQARELGRAVNNIPSSKTITIHWDNPGNPLLAAAKARAATGGRAHGGVSGSAATGGVRSNRVLVGEDGPEIVDMAPGSMVHSNPDSRRMMAGMAGGTVADGGGAGRLEVRARLDPGASDLAQRWLAESLRFEIWRAGGVEGMGGTRWAPRRA